MQLLLDFLPIIAFFVAYKLGDIYVATAVLMIAMVLLCGVSWLRTRKVSNMMLISTALALVFGTLTLLLRDNRFVQWKLTIVEWLFAIGFLLAPRFLQGQTVVQKMMGEQVKLEASQWRSLNWMWICFFLLVGGLNLYVMYQFDEATWVNFKMYGTLGMTLAFVILQGVWLAGKLPKESEPAKPTEPQN
jgi:intracellular septation protein